MRRISIVVGLVTDQLGHVLLVRKRNTRFFIQPGGKREPGESDIATLNRELNEELGIEIQAASARCFGTFSDAACNEESAVLDATVFACQTLGNPAPGAEIEELIWIDPDQPGDINLAPLTANVILPLARRLRTDARHIA